MLKKIFYKRTTCRICNSKRLSLVYRNRPSPIGEAFLKKKRNILTQKNYPINLYICKKCGLVQLLDIINPNVVYKNYLYYTKTSIDLKNHFKEYALDIKKKKKLNSKSLIIDIGSNDGTLLNNFKSKQNVIGIEPAKQISNDCNKRGIKTINSFLNEKSKNLILNKFGKADVITANNVIANIDNLQEAFKLIKLLMKDDGIFVFESYYLLNIIKNRVFDFIYHEHLSSFAIKPISFICRQYDLEIFDIKKIKTKGGSLRFYIKKKTKKIEYKKISKLLSYEKKFGIFKKKTFFELEEYVNEQNKKCYNFLNKHQKYFDRLVGIGASISCITLMYKFRLEHKITFLVDDNLIKRNMFSPGSNIKIINFEDYEEKKQKKDILLILAWRFSNQILKKHNLEKLGIYKIIRLMPKFEIL